jgi:hypothetical protein
MHKEEEMAEPITKLTRHDLEAKIVKRCWENEAFRKEFTADPAGATAKYLGVPSAGLPKIVVHQEAAGSWYIVLPPPPAKIGELSEQELESVSGASVTDYTVQLVSVGTVASVFSAEVVTRQVVGW